VSREEAPVFMAFRDTGSSGRAHDPEEGPLVVSFGDLA
jgi:hypothetical protein